MESQDIRASRTPQAMFRAAGVVLGIAALVAAGAFVYGLAALPVNTTKALAFCIVSSLLLAGIGVALLKGGEWLVNAGLVLASTGASLFALNLLLMAAAPKPPVDSMQMAIDMGAKFDTRTMFDVVKDLRSEGVQAYPRTSISTMLSEPRLRAQLGALLPLGGIAHSTTVLCKESGDYVIFESDRFGFNNDDVVYDAPGGVHTLVTGDSFAHGYCVPTGDDIAGQLRRRGTNTVSVGGTGNGPLLQLASVLEYGAAWRPPVVLWLYYTGNDLHDLIEEQGTPLLLRYLEGHAQNLPERQAEIDALLTRILDDAFVQHAEAAHAERVQSLREQATSLKTRLKQMVTLYELRRRLRIDRESLGDARNDVLPLLERIMRQADATVRSWGGELRVVYLPDWQTFADRPASTRAEVLALFERLGLPVIDFEARLREAGDPLRFFPFRLPNHYNAAGYALMAEQILQVADDSGMDVSSSR